MPTIKKSISVTGQQDIWIKSRVDTGCYGSESEVVRELNRACQIRGQETPEGILAVRTALVEAEESVKRKAYSKRSVDEIWEEAKARRRT